MSIKIGFMMLATPVLSLALAATVPAFAQSGDSASQSMRNAGQSAKDAASSSVNAVEEAAHGAVIAATDSTITATVKTALHDDKTTGRSDIHVSTTAGTVTLKGSVQSTEASKRAQELAQQTAGVKGVNNQLVVNDQGAMR